MDYGSSELCPYIERMGVCLEPEACFLRHTVMNAKAKEWTPGSFNPSPEGTTGTSTAKLEGTLNRTAAMGGITMEQFDEGGIKQTMYISEDKKDCPCCGGAVNMCSGEMCEQLGICYCMVVDPEDL